MILCREHIINAPKHACHGAGARSGHQQKIPIARIMAYLLVQYTDSSSFAHSTKPEFSTVHIMENVDLFKPFLEHGMDLDRKARQPGALMSKHIGYILPTPSEPLIPFVAILKGSREVVTTLLDHGMRLDSCNPLHQVFRRRERRLRHPSNGPGDSIEIMSLLLNHGCDINALEYAGNAEVQKEWRELERGPPLHRAISTKNVPAFEFLLDRGADPTIRNTRGFNACEIVKETRAEWPENMEWQENMRKMEDLLSAH